jgi:hypothetical protein
MAIYQARFMKYLQDRGVLDTEGRKVWAFMGEGEMDEPESLGAITLAAREQLDNLIFVVNCNLQRLDGPVRGNGKIIQELEAAFRGAGWNVIKVIWGDDWDPLLAQDTEGLLVRRMEELVDGESQRRQLGRAIAEAADGDSVDAGGERGDAKGAARVGDALARERTAALRHAHARALDRASVLGDDRARQLTAGRRLRA